MCLPDDNTVEVDLKACAAARRSAADAWRSPPRDDARDGLPSRPEQRASLCAAGSPVRRQRLLAAATARALPDPWRQRKCKQLRVARKHTTGKR